MQVLRSLLMCSMFAAVAHASAGMLSTEEEFFVGSSSAVAERCEPCFDPMDVEASSVEYWDDETFASGVACNEWVIADFYAEWCPPCRQYGPIFAQVAEELYDTLTFVKVNVDHCPDTCADYGIRYLPTTKLIHNGEVIKTAVGYMHAEKLRDFIKQGQAEE